jgi:hypothetical protein
MLSGNFTHLSEYYTSLKLATLSLTPYIASNDKKINDVQIGKDMEGSRRDLMTYYPHICLKGLKKTMRHLSHDGRCPDRNSSPVLPAYMPRPLPL